MKKEKTELSESDEYGTPRDIFDPLNARFRFSHDLAAASWSAKCRSYFTKERSALDVAWHTLKGWLFCNPPYSRGSLELWTGRARKEAELGACIVMLVPAYTGEGWFHRHVWRGCEVEKSLSDWCDIPGKTLLLRGERVSIELHFVAGRVEFEIEPGKGDPDKPKSTARFSSAIAVFRPQVASRRAA